jgi:hypothetical protein
VGIINIINFLFHFQDAFKYNKRLGNAATSIVVSIVIIIGCAGSFALHEEIKSGRIKNLFNKADATAVSNAANDSRQEKIIRVRVISNALNLRPVPADSNTPLGVLRNGEVVRVVGVTNERWLQVVTENGTEGYIAIEYVEFIDEE